jgi:60 kDa SS-A/Ro ribonucleoprotein
MLVPHFGSSRDVWVEVAAHLPIMALLRNLSNLHATGALSESRVRDHVRAKLTDPALLRQSRLLPFRFLSAYNAMKEHDVDVARWIQDGLEGSVENLPRFPGLTAIACDNSGSMSVGAISRHSQVTPRDIAGLLGAIAARVCEESRVYVFAEECREVDLGRRARILSRAEKIAGTDVGDCTHAHKVVERLTKQGTRPRRLLIFTDMQVYREGRDTAQGEPFTPLLREFRRTHSPDMRTYIFNLQPYEHFMTPADESGVSCFSGWNENLLRYVAADSGDGGASMVDRIDRMVL